jgi:uncharacterized repeat protein (TIGR03803 family)
VDLLKLRPIQCCIFLKALVGTEEMLRMMVEAIGVGEIGVNGFKTGILPKRISNRIIATFDVILMSRHDSQKQESESMEAFAVSRSHQATGIVLVCLLLSIAALKAQTQRYEVLHRFQWTDGANPYSSVVGDSAGNLYGTTFQGGILYGTVFRLDATGEALLYTFQGGLDGINPQAGLIRDSAGNLYGTTVYGGAFGQGTIFKVSATGSETLLYSFTGLADGKQPVAGVIRDSVGNLYGTTQYGGIETNPGFGVVYKLDVNGQLTVLYSFTGLTDGANPQAGLVRDSAGNLFGTAYNGGDLNTCDKKGCGVVFKLDADDKATVLHDFTGTPDGANPQASLMRDAAGNLYGTTSHGGGVCLDPIGCGTVFKLDKTGETVLYRFIGTPDGANPQAGLTVESAGNLYGTTRGGGASSYGTVFRLDATGTETVLHSFKGGRDGAIPEGSVIQDAAGNLYGTTEGGGGNRVGVVFKLKP